MLIENLTYLITFVVTAGLAVIGILVAFGLHREHKNPILQILLYQQIFLFSFFIYGIWGDIAIREIIPDLNVHGEISNKLSVLIPIIGSPFLIVSWFMLIKFGFNLNDRRITKKTVYAYFISFSAMLLTFTILFQNQVIIVSSQPLIFIVRVLVLINMGIHLIFAITMLNPAGAFKLTVNKKYLKSTFLGYLSGVVLYSVALFVFSYFGFLFTCLAIILLFGVSATLPVAVRFFLEMPATASKLDSGFEHFCRQYEISKREAEIILEICSGKTNKAISEKLFITLQTVKDHNHRIFTKTQVKSRVQLANLVRERTKMNNLPNTTQKIW